MGRAVGISQVEAVDTSGSVAEVLRGRFTICPAPAQPTHGPQAHAESLMSAYIITSQSWLSLGPHPSWSSLGGEKILVGI